MTERQKYTYEQIPQDSYAVRIYTLKNGLKVYLAQNDDAPKIQTYIPVRTGSNNDPHDNTGLSHYLEHMLFKGTSKIGTINWDKERVLLEEIAELYEHHKAEKNPERKKEIYKKIDEISQEASQYAIANEYDKTISSLGATGTNAHTWLDETVYKNNIPSNELEKWLKIEKERFSELVLRLFHTELESVYEEFNRAQDNDQRLISYAVMETIFPTHPNGQQTTLGTAEHLKNPSMKAIYEYFNTYYVPNNMAMVLVGDLDFDKTIKLIDEYFGTFEYKELPPKKEVVEQPMTSIVTKTITSPSTPRLQIVWRTDSYGTHEARLAEIVAHILSNNGEAGLLDLNINQKQKALYARSYAMGFKKYGIFSAVIVPKNEQTLDEGKALLLEQLDLIKKGDFPDWVIPAIINDMKLQKMKHWETADGLASALYDVFIKERSWEEELDELNKFASITKNEVVEFANHFFKDNYTVIYKEKGENNKLIRVENPGITPIKINREEQSPFLKDILNTKSEHILPQFIDYQKSIKTEKIGDKKIHFVENKYHDIAEVHFLFPMGSDHNRELSLATDILQYLGTDQYTSQDLRKEFFKIGISNDFYTSKDEFHIVLTGLEEHILKGIALLHHWLNHIKPDQNIYDQTVKIILENRAVAKKDKARVMAALVNYAKFGRESRSRDVISKERLEEIKVEELMKIIENLKHYPHEIFFYGKDFNRFKNGIQNYISPATQSIAEPKIYPEPTTDGKIYFTNYDMVQVEMSKIGRANLVKPKNFGKINVFNEYFGKGLSSIVFQEIRESKSLAYSANVAYSANATLGKHDYVTSYIGTQTDKLSLAVDAIQQLMSELPQINFQFENAKNSVLKQIATGRVKRTNIFFNLKNLHKLGINYDLREEMYTQIEQLTLAELTDFYNNEIKPVTFNTALIGKKENLDMKTISSMGELIEVDLEELFGY